MMEGGGCAGIALLYTISGDSYRLPRTVLRHRFSAGDAELLLGLGSRTLVVTLPPWKPSVRNTAGFLIDRCFEPYAP